MNLFLPFQTDGFSFGFLACNISYKKNKNENNNLFVKNKTQDDSVQFYTILCVKFSFQLICQK